MTDWRIITWWIGFVLYIVTLVLVLIGIVYEHGGGRKWDRFWLHFTLAVGAAIVLAGIFRRAWGDLHA